MENDKNTVESDMKSIETAKDIKVVIDELVYELDDYSTNKKKAAALRARKSSLALGKLLKHFRKQSVDDCKTF